MQHAYLVLTMFAHCVHPIGTQAQTPPRENPELTNRSRIRVATRPRILSFAVLLVLAGCGQFFVTEANPIMSSGADIYVANAETANMAGFSIASTGLTAVSNSPYSIGVAPNALAITPNNSFVYTSTLAGGIYGYSVESGGALALVNGGSPVVSGISPVALRVDTTGNWLIVVDPTPAAYVFAINTSTGTLTSEGSLPLSTGNPYGLVITPNNSFVYISLGTGGVAILSFNSSTGVLTSNNQVLSTKQALDADQGLAVNPAGTLSIRCRDRY